MGEKYTLNVCGEVCPMPVIKTKAILDKMKPGDALEVIVDYPPSKENVKRLAEHEGYQVQIEEAGEKIKLTITK
ncbi:MAG: sulfurtransferase TusA family protein [Candidatus Desulfofervidaceae bacterium]|nr:sulfurtransferase TusA family protein [Candidatus Desulfofervidaceae bacterium]